jgi:hypothetical protein
VLAPDPGTGSKTCKVCGANLWATDTDLPFNPGDTSIVMLRGLPVLERGDCPEHLIDDAAMRQVNHILARVDGSADLDIVRFAA